jgi:hypothetical protein
MTELSKKVSLSDCFPVSLRVEIIGEKLRQYVIDIKKADKLVDFFAGEFAIRGDWVSEWRLEEAKKEFHKLENKWIKWHYRLSALAGEENKNSIVSLEIIRNIPIKTILNNYNIELIANKKFKVRREKTPSCWLYEKSNRYWDFGDNSGGSVIDLVMNLEKCSVAKAIQILKKLI